MIGRLDVPTALRLGRVSNLPTVWSNVLAGITLSGAAVEAADLLLLLPALSLMYVGGMFLNDAFDAEIDARERPNRPIPSGRVSAATVFALGFAMLAGAVLLLALADRRAGVAGLALALAITAYDRFHKGNPLSPVLMGLCRMLVYVAAACAVVGSAPVPVLAGAGMLLCYLIGLTYVAKQENLNQIGNLWPLVFLAIPFIYLLPAATTAFLPATLLTGFAIWVLWSLSWLRPGRRVVPRAVVALIAGISLLDATLIATTGAVVPSAMAVVCFGLTLIGQRWVSGT